MLTRRPTPAELEQALSLVPDNQAFYAGAWQGAAQGKTFTVCNPLNQKPLKAVPDCGPDEAALAIQASASAQVSWRALTARQRADGLRRWYEALLAHEAELALLMTLEQGKPLAESLGEVRYGASFLEWFGEEAKRIYGETIPAFKAGTRILVTPEPVGVCAIATPWNFPIAMMTRKVGAALAAGCSVIVKPAAETPLCALALVRLAEQAGLPPNVIQVLPTTEPEPLFQVFQQSPVVRKISFTGSTAVGQHLMREAATTLKRVSLELGGNAPFIVFDAADIPSAVQGAMQSKFRNMGQTCVCANRFLVQRAIYPAFAHALAEAMKELRCGDGLEPGIDQGPLIHVRALHKVESHVADALAKGARCVLGGSRPAPDSPFFQPTLLLDASPDMLVFKEETFGPVAALMPFDSEEEALRLANDTPFGLAAYVYTQNIAQALRVAEGLECGMVAINEGILSSEVAPFGGIKASGMGREGSRHGVHEYVQLKYVLLGGI
jgi:succinate-semialdehyde dehydrogenase/glutarate-semialdehyde dehydrogenase